MEAGDENKMKSEGVGIFNSEKLFRLLLLESNLAVSTGPTDPPLVISLLIPPLLLFIRKLKDVALLLLLLLGFDGRLIARYYQILGACLVSPAGSAAGELKGRTGRVGSVVPPPTGGTMPFILALCLLRKYLFQNFF